MTRGGMFRVRASRVAGGWLVVSHAPAAGRGVGCLPCGWVAADTRRGVRPGFQSLPVRGGRS